MRLATFNLLSGRCLTSGQTLEADLRESARLLDADILGLQEVDRLQPRSSLVDQTAVVAETLGAPHWRFVPTLNGTPTDAVAWTPSFDDDDATTTGPAYGIALVSRLPVREWQVRRFAAAPMSWPVMVAGGQRIARMRDQPRVALAAVVDGPRGPFTVITAHLSIVPGWNVAQLRAVIAWAATLPAPRLLMGDLNIPGPIVRMVAKWDQLAKLGTFPAGRPRLQLDHVLGNGISADAVRSAESVQLPISDHRALIVTIEM